MMRTGLAQAGELIHENGEDRRMMIFFGALGVLMLVLLETRAHRQMQRRIHRLEKRLTMAGVTTLPVRQLNTAPPPPKNVAPAKPMKKVASRARTDK
jgi:hypothetical protein